MKVKPILGCFAFAILATGCMEHNPLQKHPAEKIAAFLVKESKVPLAKCAKIWAHPETANNAVLTECDPIATETAILLNKEGFGPGITSENVRLPEIWPYFLTLREARQEQLKKDARNAFDWNKGR